MNCGNDNCNNNSCCRGRGDGARRAADTIMVRNTVTGPSGTEARILDVTGPPNHVLDFIIPRGSDGEMGPQGETGPQGEPGIDGVADRIAVVETVTGEAGTEANVEDDFAMGVHNLTFTIPRGEDSPSLTSSIAQLYTTTTQTLTTVGQIFDFDINQNFRNSLTTQRTVQVQNGGAHKIEFGFVFSALTETVLSLYINELEMVNTRLLFTDEMKGNSAVFLVVLNQNDELSIRVQMTNGDAITADGTLNGYLIVTPAG